MEVTERRSFVLSEYYHLLGKITQLFLFDLDEMNPLVILEDTLEEHTEFCIEDHAVTAYVN